MNKWPSKLAALLLVASLCLSAGCSAQNLAKLPASGAVESFSVKVNLTNQKDDRVQVQTAIPEFTGFGAAGELNAKIKQISNDGIAQVKQDTEGMENSAGAGSLFYQSYFDYTRHNDILSVWITSENYTGGAHGAHYINSFTVNTKTGEFYTSLGSLLQDPATAKKEITDKIIADIQKQPDAFFPEAVQTVKDKNGDYSFYLDGQNLVVYFELYELLPYAGGIPKFSIPLADLKTKQSFEKQDPLGDNRLNGETIAFKNTVYTDSNGVYLPLEETAAALNHIVVKTGEAYTLNGKPVEVKKVNGAAYAPLVFFTGTLGDFVVYDGTVLRIFTQVGSITVAGVPLDSSAASAENEPPASTSQNNAADENTEEILAYIKSYDATGGQITFDPIEWVTSQDTKRMKELGLTKEDMPNGFHIYNPSEQTESLKLGKNVEFQVLYPNGVYNAEGARLAGEEQFQLYLSQSQGTVAPYRLTVQNGEVLKIEEQYVP